MQTMLMGLVMALSILAVGKFIIFNWKAEVKEWNVSWDLKPADIHNRASLLAKRVRQTYDEIAATDRPTWRNTAWRLALFEADYMTEFNTLNFLQYVSPDRHLRNASYAVAQNLSALDVEMEMRKDVFDKFVAVQSTMDSSLPPEIRRYIDKKVLNGRRNGLHLDEQSKRRVESMLKEESQLCIEFEHAISKENTVLEFEEAELAGCPEDFIDGLPKLQNGKRQISLKYPHYIPASETAFNPETRRQLEKAFNSRCLPENRKILERVLQIRTERAKILNFPSHSDFILQTRMAKNASTVSRFLNELGGKLRDARAKETTRLLELKKEESLRLGIDYFDELEPSDLRYYMNLVTQRDYYLDKQKLKKYFPLEAVKSGILKMYQSLLGLTFIRVPTGKVWHPHVEMYFVSDQADGLPLGYFYLDLHPRENKYSHAAVFSLQPGCLRRKDSTCVGDGVTGNDEAVRQLAVVAMVMNFAAPSESHPIVYLLHDEVESFFHEFGHVMHQLCAKSYLAMFSGTHVETDFVECPSQMLENWVWTEVGLKALLGDELNGMSVEMLQRLLNSRKANTALFYSRQILLSSYDQAIHLDSWKNDSWLPFAELSKKWLGIAPTPGTFMPASFEHLCGGYDARYYSYLWSEVFSADLFETRFMSAPDGGCMSPTVGREYRDKILAPGGSKDAMDMLKDFLGREPTNAAFFRLLDLHA